jgi:simple sugar transport system permease protein
MSKVSSISKFSKSSEFNLFMVNLVLVLLLSIFTNGRFIQFDNILDMLIGYAPMGIIAAGGLVVIISGGIDLSFMAIATIAQYLMALYMLNYGGNFFVIFLIVIITGILLGIINAVLVSSLKAPAMIITIATRGFFYGLLMYLSNGVWLNNFPHWFSVKTTFLKTAIPLGSLLIVYVFTAFILRHTRTGRKIFSIGGNIESARRNGVNILMVQLFIYCFAGAIAGIGSVVQCYLIQNVAPNSLVGNEMDVIAMIVLGGVTLSGGKGTVFGTFLGFLLIAIMSNGLVLLGVSSYWHNFFVGVIILISFCITGYKMIKDKQKEQKGRNLDEAEIVK